MREAIAMKIRLAVIFGGKSVEHEVSVISAIQAVNNLDGEKYEVFPVYITKNGEFYHGRALTDIEAYADINALIGRCARASFYSADGRVFLAAHNPKKPLRGKSVSEIDAALPAVHGTNVEDGALQGYLKTLGLPFAGSGVLASTVCMDKYVSKILLKEAGFPVLDCLRFTSADNNNPTRIVKTVTDKFPFPVVVKPVNLGSSVGIAKVSAPDGLEEALDTAFSFADAVIVERAVKDLKEINCSVVGDSAEALASECEEPHALDEILSYSDKYLSGGKGLASLKRKIPADITPELREKVRRLAADAFKTLNCSGVARVDFLSDIKTGELWLNEINTIPGSLAFYLWEPVGLKYSDLLDKLIALALKRHRLEKEIVYSFDTNILSSGGLSGGKGRRKV
jgi:D-alanine-D-alanine ligase